jgi:selenophosphate synthase
VSARRVAADTLPPHHVGASAGTSRSSSAAAGSAAPARRSDIYAMGGRPLFALNLLAWPSSELPLSMLTEVLDGGAQTGAECGFLVVGGHSVDDPERST